MRHYALNDFLRYAPNELLAEYFLSQTLLSAFNFSQLTPKKIAPLFIAIQQLPDDTRKKIEKDFQDIFALAYEAGIKLLIEEGQYKNFDFTIPFDTLKGHEAKAFWAFLNKREIFNDTIRLACRDNLSGNWRKRRDLPILNKPDFSEKTAKLEVKVASYFQKEGRGRACTLDYVRRENHHYFFIYPEDYSQSHLHYVAGDLRRDHHSPAFQVIFLYNSKTGVLDIYYSGNRKGLIELQKIFANSILDLDKLPPSTKEVYDLNSLKYSQFRFKLRAEWGIQKICIVELGLLRWVDREPRYWVLKCGNNNPNNIYRELDIVAPDYPQDHRPSRESIKIYAAKICVEFAPRTGNKPNQRTFSITNEGCNLKHDEDRDKILRQMIIDSGLEGANNEGEFGA